MNRTRRAKDPLGLVRLRNLLAVLGRDLALHQLKDRVLKGVMRDHSPSLPPGCQTPRPMREANLARRTVPDRRDVHGAASVIVSSERWLLSSPGGYSFLLLLCIRRNFTKAVCKSPRLSLASASPLL